jgi:hypothetical protein
MTLYAFFCFYLLFFHKVAHSEINETKIESRRRRKKNNLLLPFTNSDCRSSCACCRSLSRSFRVFDANNGRGLTNIINIIILIATPNFVKSLVIMTLCHNKCLKNSLTVAAAKRFTFNAINVLGDYFSIQA